MLTVWKTSGHYALTATRSEPNHNDRWKARCGESRTPGLEGGVEKPAIKPEQGAPRLPYPTSARSEDRPRGLWRRLRHSWLGRLAGRVRVQLFGKPRQTV